MSDIEEQEFQTKVSDLKKRLKQLSKNELVRVAIGLGNSVAFLESQVKELKDRVESEND